MIKRNLSVSLRKAASEYPVVTVLGPRQSGKTTLVRDTFPDYAYANLEDPILRNLAATDPRGFFRNYPPPVILDEIQRVPDLCSTIQAMSDESGKNGEYVLTGSAQLSLRESISQSLTGRNALAVLMPLSLSELSNEGIEFDRDEAIYSGFFPRIVSQRQNPTLAYRDYLQTYIERDVRMLANIRNISAFERFLVLLAGRVGQLLNVSSLATASGVSIPTLTEWMNVLEASFIIFRLNPFQENYGKRLVKAPKVYFSDTGLVCSLLGIENARQAGRDPLMGQIFENLVVMEFAKEFHNRRLTPRLSFFRDQNGREIDLVVESNRRLLPVEIKASRSWNQDFLKGIRFFSKLSDRAEKGIVVGAFEETLELEEAKAIPFNRIASIIPIS